MVSIISIIFRAVCFGFLSSFSNAPCTWQNSHSTPRDALMNCIAGINWSAGIPFSVWTFLNCSSAFLGSATCSEACPKVFDGAFIAAALPPACPLALRVAIAQTKNKVAVSKINARFFPFILCPRSDLPPVQVKSQQHFILEVVGAEGKAASRRLRTRRAELSRRRRCVRPVPEDAAEEC